MARTVDPEVLAGFLDEARGYLPQIRCGIESLRTSPADWELHLDEAYRHTHCIKGASAMVGLSGLSQVAGLLEQAFEDVAGGILPRSDETASALRQTAELVEACLDPARPAGDCDADAVAEVTQRFHRLRGQPSPGGAAASAEPEEEAKDSVDPELLAVFASEAEDHLRVIAAGLSLLKERPADREALQDVRRSAHTLKGSAAMVGFRTLTRLAHRMEDLLDALHDGEQVVTEDVFRLLLATADALAALAAGEVNEEVLRGLYQRYDQAMATAAGRAEQPEQAAVPAPAPEAAVRGAEQFVRVPLERLDGLVRLVSELVIARHTFEQRLSGYLHQLEELRLSTERLQRATSRLETQYEVSALGGRLALAGGPSSPAALAPWQAQGFDELELDRYTEFHLLSRELAETAADVTAIGRELSAFTGDLEGQLVRQTQLSSEIQDGLTRLRMVPFNTLTSRLERTVRGVADARGRTIEVAVEGGSTEVDKTVLEEMAEPLLHLLRNAADHGIEDAEVRRERAKPEAGTVWVRAFHQGNQVVLQVSDDGGGIDLEAVRSRAVAGGCVDPEDSAALGEKELFALLFETGFSTARVVNEVSGRGIGLDVVKARVQRLKGTVEVTSRPGAGTTFTLRLPLVLAVMRALLVKAHGQTFAVPLAALNGIDRLSEEQANDPTTVRLGDHSYPRIDLGKALELPEAGDRVSRPPVLLMHADGREVAVVVDHILGGREVVVKNLGSHLRQVHGVSGATLLGDGTVVLIVNPSDLLRPPARRRSPPHPTLSPGGRG
jgi:chemosensory pili system protein ChpA (sensor histidine kinase/response regulator)